MIIALDYDDTISKSPDFWAHFIETAQSYGHTVHIVTARNHTLIQDIVEWRYSCHFNSGGFDNPQIFATDYQPKRQFMEDQGIMIDVWIDDCPEAIVAPIYQAYGDFKIEATN